MMTIRKQLTVEAPLERAFRVFTANMGAWWPKDHHIGTAALKDCVIEPKVNGCWYELGVDGTECEWGKVLEWHPPLRVVLAWQINADWKYDPTLLTEVEITFSVIGANETRVDIDHRRLERIGEKAAQARAALDSDQGWSSILKVFGDFAQR